MRVLIVEKNPSLGWLWSRHLERVGTEVTLVADHQTAADHLDHTPVDAILLNLTLGESHALGIADYARFRQPDAKVVFVSNAGSFSDGSIFELVPSACAFLPVETRPEDLAAVIEHHCSRPSADNKRSGHAFGHLSLGPLRGSGFDGNNGIGKPVRAKREAALSATS